MHKVLRGNFLLFPSIFFPYFFLTMSFAKSTTVFCVVCNIQSTSADKILPPVQLITLMLFLIFLTGLKSYTVCLFDLSLFFLFVFPSYEQFLGLWIPDYVWVRSLPWRSRTALSLANASVQSLSGHPGAPAYLTTAKMQRERKVWDAVQNVSMAASYWHQSDNSSS